MTTYSRYGKPLLIFLSLLWPGWLSAQISPGDLSAVHQDLEGLANCTSCHETGKQITGRLCLDCHKVLKARIDAGKGLHARREYANCIECHNEHHGRSFEQIFWKNGMEKFDHALTGFQLKGAHARQKCRDCHQAKNTIRPEVLIAAKKDLKRTFLGLGTACLSCHDDTHRGQLSDDCTACHNENNWKPADGFNHDAARFRLSGLHLSLDCATCHKTAVENSGGERLQFVRFKGMTFANCRDCHKDPHSGKFGQDCAGCHETGGWQKVKLAANFRHDQTGFPLKGRHRDMSCESCHRPGRPHRGLSFANCTDCHQDIHAGQFTGRAQKGECSECHTVEGFTPARFSLADHQQTDFPLAGAHQAIPCIACHSGGPQVIRTRGTMLPVNRFSIPDQRCQSCHQDPHKGQVDAHMTADKGCESCHNVASWREITFDHAVTRFPLTEAHARASCAACHSSPDSGPRFVELSALCQDCHQDVHRGQFAANVILAGQTRQITDCGRCHIPRDWQVSNFDHDRQTQFSLEGAHQDLACASCHKATFQPDGTSFTKFRPLAADCAACHG